MCAYVCVCTYVCVRVCDCVCVCAPEVNTVCLSSNALHFNFFEIGSLTEHGTYRSAKLAGHVPKDLPVSGLHSWGHRRSFLCLIFVFLVEKQPLMAEPSL